MAAGGLISTGSLPKLLWPGINTTWGMVYPEHEEQWIHLVEQFNSSQNYEEDVQVVGSSTVPIKPEGSPIQFQSNIQGYVTRYTHVTYASGLVITWEEMQDNLYAKYIAERTPNLKFGFRQTRENVVANLFNRAFNSAYVGGNGIQMVSTAQALSGGGGTASNRLAVDAQLSEASLEDMCIQIGDATDDVGNRIGLQAMSLHIPNALQFTAERILKSMYRTNTANNDINALKSMGKIPMGMFINNYFSSANAWFVRTDIPKAQGLKFFRRHPLELFNDNDSDTLNAKAYAVERYSTGWTDWRAVFGTSGR